MHTTVCVYTSFSIALFRSLLKYYVTLLKNIESFQSLSGSIRSEIRTVLVSHDTNPEQHVLLVIL